MPASNKLKQIISSPSVLKITCKLLYDSLFLLILFFVLELIADGLLPGIISAHIGFYFAAILILIDIVAIDFLTKKIGISFTNFTHKKTASLLVAVLALLLFNSLYRINIILNLIILLLLFATGYFFYKVFPEK